MSAGEPTCRECGRPIGEDEEVMIGGAIVLAPGSREPDVKPVGNFHADCWIAYKVDVVREVGTRWKP